MKPSRAKNIETQDCRTSHQGWDHTAEHFHRPLAPAPGASAAANSGPWRQNQNLFEDSAPELQLEAPSPAPCLAGPTTPPPSLRSSTIKQSSLALAALTGLLAAGSLLAGSRVEAQLSPNCERNGRRDYCAITPIAGASNEKQSFDMITFADHSVYEVLKTLSSCKRHSEKVETCNAKIISPPGNPKAIAAYYRRTFYEGGVRHEYVGKGIHLTYFFLD